MGQNGHQASGSGSPLAPACCVCLPGRGAVVSIGIPVSSVSANVSFAAASSTSTHCCQSDDSCLCACFTTKKVCNCGYISNRGYVPCLLFLLSFSISRTTFLLSLHVVLSGFDFLRCEVALPRRSKLMGDQFIFRFLFGRRWQH